MEEEYGRLFRTGASVVEADFGGTGEPPDDEERVAVEGHPGELLLDAPPGVELRR